MQKIVDLIHMATFRSHPHADYIGHTADGHRVMVILRSKQLDFMILSPKGESKFGSLTELNVIKPMLLKMELDRRRN